jgi:hypothetical protein
MKHHQLTGFAIAVTMAATLACTNSPTPPTAPQPPGGGGGAAGSTLKATAPNVLSPAGGIELEDLSPVLTIANAAPQYVPDLPLSYIFEVLNSANQVVYRSATVAAGSGGQTAHEVNLNLNVNEVHTWRAWAVYQGLSGPTSAAGSFKTSENNKYGVSCAHHGTPIAIVACRAAQHGGMDHEETIQFLKEVAYDLNKAVFTDKGGWGILIKTVGNNCHGYSCDIICEGNGPDQNQYDVLIDEVIPKWGEVSEVTVRTCEFIK